VILNPHAHVRVTREDGRATAVVIQAPVRGRGLIVHDTQDDPILFDPLLQFIERRGPRDAVDKVLLRRVGLLIDENERSERVPFEPRLHGVASDDDPLVGIELAGEIVLQDGPMPAPWDLRPPETVEGHRPTVWHRDSRTGIVSFYWPDDAVANVLRRLSKERRLEVPRSVRAALRGSGIIAEDQHSAPNEPYAELLETLGYAVIPRLWPSVFHRAVSSYVAGLVDNGWCVFSEDSGRFVAHNEPLCYFLLVTLNEVVQRAAGKALKPSYVYLSAYREGATLREHRDRPQCEYTVSVLLHYEPLHDSPSPWPLIVREEGSEDATAIHHRIGDAFVFRGRRLHHRRPPLPAGHQATFLLFHYVFEDFDGPFD
jgi:hypothetical protein